MQADCGRVLSLRSAACKLKPSMSAHGGKRLPQKASGYRRTMVAGVTTNLDGELTGALPGKLLQSGSLNAAMA